MLFIRIITPGTNWFSNKDKPHDCIFCIFYEVWGERWLLISFDNKTGIWQTVSSTKGLSSRKYRKTVANKKNLVQELILTGRMHTSWPFYKCRRRAKLKIDKSGLGNYTVHFSGPQSHLYHQNSGQVIWPLAHSTSKTFAQWFSGD